jgi:hypothetical protein
MGRDTLKGRAQICVPVDVRLYRPMRDGFSHLTKMVVIAAAGAAVTSVYIAPTSAQAPAASATAPAAGLKTPWGEPPVAAKPPAPFIPLRRR